MKTAADVLNGQQGSAEQPAHDSATTELPAAWEDATRTAAEAQPPAQSSDFLSSAAQPAPPFGSAAQPAVLPYAQPPAQSDEVLNAEELSASPTDATRTATEVQLTAQSTAFMHSATRMYESSCLGIAITICRG